MFPMTTLSSSCSTPKKVALTLLIVAGCLLAAPPSCEAHGFLLNPLSRARLLGYGEYEASSGNGNGDGSPGRLPDVCGDPHQMAPDFNIKGRQTAIQGECKQPPPECNFWD